MSRAAESLDLETATVAELGAALSGRALTSVELVEAYLERIERFDRSGPAIRSIRGVLPDALERAAARDRERMDGQVRGPLHGIPVLLKDNIDVAGVPTTAGALALEHSTPDRDAALVTALREAGAVLLAKTNLTELANFMADDMPSGYSSLGGQVLNPYDLSVTPSGSSSGSGAAAAMGLGAVAVGTETDGSIISPAEAQSLVGLKPTLGLVPAAGVFPIASSQDCPGPMTRTVADAAALLGALTGRVPDVRPQALSGARIAVCSTGEGLAGPAADLWGAALDELRAAGATVVEVPALAETNEMPLLVHEFARDVDAYLARLPASAPVRTLAELAAWNEAHAADALKYGQKWVEQALAVDHERDHAAYVEQKALHQRTAGEHGVDAVVRAHGVAAIAFPSWRGCGIAARAGYPSITVPAGYLPANRRPFGITLLGPAHSEDTLLSLAADFEGRTRHRRPVRDINPSALRS